MPSPFQVVCVGVVTIDALALVDRYPAADERVVGDQVCIVGGGPAANAAVVLARQGIPVAFVGRVGADLQGEQAVRLLEAEGVDVSGVMRDRGVPTQASCVVVSRETKTRAISTLAVPPLPSLAEMGSRAVELVASAEWVHTDHLGFGPVAHLLATMSPSTRPRLAVDAGNPVAELDISSLDLYVPTTESLAAQYGQPATAEGVEKAAGLALAEGARAVVATSGSEGSTAWWSAAFAPGTDPGRVHAPASTGVEIMSLWAQVTCSTAPCSQPSAAALTGPRPSGRPMTLRPCPVAPWMDAAPSRPLQSSSPHGSRPSEPTVARANP